MRRSKTALLARAKGLSVEELLKAMYEQHGSQVRVAAELGLSQSRVSQLLREYRLVEKTVLVKDKEGA
jgi:predicted transcriptional regulator